MWRRPSIVQRARHAVASGGDEYRPMRGQRGLELTG
jgi:hypothetical protein